MSQHACIFSATTTLDTPRLVLVPIDLSTPEHLDFYIALLNAPEAIAATGDYGIRTREQVLKLINSTLISPSICPVLSEPGVAIFMAHLKPEHARQYPSHQFPGKGDIGPLIGSIDLAQRSSRLPPDMGWAFLSPYWGQGYATEAGRACLQFWTAPAGSERRGGYGIEEIIALPNDSNMASLRTAQKIGFIENGYAVMKDETHESRTVVYTLPSMKRFEEGTRFSFWGDDRT